MNKIKRALHTIRYEFSKEEIAQKSNQLAETVRQKHELVEQKKSVASDYKAKIDAQDSIMTMLSNHITSGFEMRSLECEVEYDFDKGIKRFYYQGVLYDTQSMTDEDRQLEID